MAKILIIDDDPDIRLAVQLCLEGAGHTVVPATAGPEGLQKVVSEKPDLIILDVMMNTTTEGFQVALKLRSLAPDSPYLEYRDIPVLMLTAIHSTTPLRFGPDEEYLPVDDFVDKPFDPPVLVRKVEALLKKKGKSG